MANCGAVVGLRSLFPRSHATGERIPTDTISDGARHSDRFLKTEKLLTNLMRRCKLLSTQPPRKSQTNQEVRLDKETFSRVESLSVLHPVATTAPRGLPARGPRSALGTDLICFNGR